MAQDAALWKMAVIRGALAIAAGAALVAWPGLVLGVAVIIYGAYSIALGLVDGSALLLGKIQTSHRPMMLVLAALNVVVGLLLVTAPQRTTAVLLAIVGVAIIIEGAARVLRTFRSWEGGVGSWVMLAMGVVELLIGVAFAVEPLLAGVGFVAILGGLVLVYGIVGVGAGLAAKASETSVGGPMRPA